jgi:N-acyl-D-amino-acid deacylase
VRAEVMGRVDREPTPEELARMESLVDRAMTAGAVGLSTGLIYIPGTYAKTPELVALARVAARHGGLYVSHIRDEGMDVMASVEEAIEVGRQAGLPVQISHHKVASKRQWGRSTDTLAKIEAARAAGVDVTLDQYPYTASSTRLSVMLPSWALAGDYAAIQKRLADPALRRKMAAEMRDTIVRRNGRRRLDHAVIASYAAEPALEGKRITEITALRRRPATLDGDIATVFELMEHGGASTVLHTMDDHDVDRIMRFSQTMIASDGGVQDPGEARPHPRSYGTNARVLARYVRERHVLALEEAIRRMTSLPAQRFGFVDRGLVRPGAWADLVVFDEKTVVDRATFAQPHAYAEGFRYVLVNGEAVWQEGKHTGAKPGKVLLRR